MFQHSICVFLAPALVSAAAFPWAGPLPTFGVAEPDNWSPAPTEAPRLGAIELFKRQNPEDKTCGYISGSASNSLTCNNADHICATNSFYGVHGCCDPVGIETCILPTTCIPSASLSASCNADCSANDYITKCTDSRFPACYEWHYVYASTTMTEHGCDSTAFTQAALRTIKGATSIPPNEAPGGVTDPVSDRSSTTSSSSSTRSSSTPTPSPTLLPPPPEPEKKSSNIGPIVGGVVGGVAAIGAAAFAIFFLLRRNKNNKQNAALAASGANQPFMGPAPGVTEYKPQTGGFTSPQQYPATPVQGYYNSAQEAKPWQQQPQYTPVPGTPAPQYSGPVPMAQTSVPAGVAEAEGVPVQQPQQHPHPQQPYPPHQSQQQQQQHHHHVYEAP